MNSIFQFIGTFASIFSIPLAIILFFKTSDARQNQIRLEIIRSLSYRIGEGKKLNKIEISAVFNSKVREHNIRKPSFNEISILEDIIADAVSNPFLASEQKTSIICNISEIIMSYGVKESQLNKINVENGDIKSVDLSDFSKTGETHGSLIKIFTVIATLLSVICATAIFFLEDTFLNSLSNYLVSAEALSSFAIAVFTFVIARIIDLINRKK